MAKHVIIAAMEEAFGEYLLNVSPDNLKIAALRGQIKLENVQLDGDLIGSHILGAVGLNGLGVLSCCAKSIQISVPWKNLEKSPTKIVVSGMHLVCVPLTPSTANRMYGAGTSVDPRCTLRTRAKRLVLGRLERNFWNGQVQGGPLMKRIHRAVKDVERDKRKNRRDKSENSEMEHVLDDLVHSLGDGSTDQDTTAASSFYSADDLPNIPRDWKVKLREKIMRNMEASVHDVHIRLEVPESEQDGSNNDDSPRKSRKKKANSAFALGFTVESIVVRTANEKWEVGSHDKRPHAVAAGIASEDDHLGPNEYVARDNKIGYFNNLCVYFDEDPPMLLCEADALQGNYHKLTADKLHSRISVAMEALILNQEPGAAIRQSLSAKGPREGTTDRPHNYICESLDAEVRVRTSDRTRPGPISCSADVLPFNFTFNIRPSQYLQYQRLIAAIALQNKFDTMLRQRPNECPSDDPRAWWKYAIECITSRPNWRPWEDTLRIVKCRTRYLELVVKKNAKPGEGIGFHSGLSSKESEELLAMEDFLPIEALQAFHLIALRQVYGAQQQHQQRQVSSVSGKPSWTKLRMPTLRAGSSKKKSDSYSGLNDDSLLETNTSHATSKSTADDTTASTTMSLLDAMTLRLGRKTWFVDWKLHDATCRVVIRRERREKEPLHLVVRANGNARSFGIGKRDFAFDLTQCEMLHGADKVLYICAADEGLEGISFAESADFTDDSQIFDLDNQSQLSLSPERVANASRPDMAKPSDFLSLPPPGTVCRFVAGKVYDSVKFSMSAHPATLKWTTALFDNITEFLVDHCSGTETDLTRQLRSAATPLARKAQLALLSPDSLAVYLNIAGPKVLVPLVSGSSEGTLFLDAGTLRMAGSKDEGEVEVQWNVRARDIGVNFVHGVNLSRFGNEAPLYLRSFGVAQGGKGDTAVIRPFSIDVDSLLARDSPAAGRDVSFADPVRKVDVLISPVCLNLVDAEMLARSFGKWYARGLHLVRRRVQTTDGTKRAATGLPDDPVSPLQELKHLPQMLCVKLEKMEMAIEGHSKKQSGSDERSLGSLDSLHDFAPPTRAYLVEIHNVSFRRSRLEHTAVTKLHVADASIVRLRDVALYTPLKVRRDNIDSENCILSHCTEKHGSYKGRAEGLDGHYARTQLLPGETASPSAGIFRAAFLRNHASHLDEVEIDIDSLVLRVTPTTLKDCAKAARRIVELAQLATKEMERKVHEEGRKARRKHRGRDFDSSQIGSVGPSLLDRPVSPAFSEAMTTFTEITMPPEKPPPKPSFDSSFLIRVTINDSTVLAGRPTATTQRLSPKHQSPPYAVIQVLSNALVMFQSIENPDATGIKTLHVSVDNVSALVTTEFERVSLSRTPPMIDPTGAEFRVVYSTEHFGCVVSQDISLDCDSVKSCLTPNDISIMINISRTMFDRLRAFGVQQNVGSSSSGWKSGFSNLIRYKKKGTGIATRIRAEIQRFSFVLLRAYKSHFGAPEFLDFNINQVKGLLEGCISALSGECTASVSVNFYNFQVPGWEYVIEPCPINLGVEQMPNELVLCVAPSCPVQLNLTGILLQDFAEMNYEIARNQRGANVSDSAVLNPSVLATVGLRRATKARSVSIDNRTGFDLLIAPEKSSSVLSPGDGTAPDGTVTLLAFLSGDVEETVSLRLAGSSATAVGEREPVAGLQITADSVSARLLPLKPTKQPPGRQDNTKLADGRASPESLLSDRFVLDSAYYNAEPVVDWCMQNQRLKASVLDVFSLEKGEDLLASSVWSPEDDHGEATQQHGSLSEYVGQSSSIDVEASDDASSAATPSRSANPQRAVTSTTGHIKKKSNWLRPYLKNDSPEWTDMTCMLSMARERVMLPDSKWIWVDEWSVDLSGELAAETDADGWSYEVEFETFSREKRHYERGDACRRRRWTRTRIVRPPPIDDPFRQLKFVWDTSTDENGCINIVVRSHVRIKNTTTSVLFFFAYTPSWDEDQLVGTAAAGEVIDVPVTLASAAYLRIAKNTGAQYPVSLVDCVHSRRFSIVPSSYTSSRFVRTSMDLKDVSSTTLHFLAEIKSENGIVDVVIEPVFRLTNLLPCQLECQVGHVVVPAEKLERDASTNQATASATVTKTETLVMQSGKEGACVAVNPWRTPHISLRVPGYRWSAWKRIVNRKADATWRPSVNEDEWLFNAQGDKKYAEELKTLVRFERLGDGGDPLVLVVSVGVGHCPIIRVYAQYWIIDKTGFGCRFAEGFADLLGAVPDPDTSRRSYVLAEEARDPEIKSDMEIPGHQWSIGSCGMSLYFSQRQKITLAIETGVDRLSKRSKKARSKWMSPLDVSNVIPKTVFSVDELNGSRRFELAIYVTLCPGMFARTKMISLLPRYQIVNLLHRELVVAQDGCLEQETVIPSQSSLSFHWEKSALPPKIRLGAPSTDERARGEYDGCWTKGRLQVDRIGITSLRLPTTNTLVQVPMVVQTEVRLATKDQSSAVVVVIWSGNEKANPLYTLRNLTRHTILCRQPLQDDNNDLAGSEDKVSSLQDACTSKETAVFECGAEVGPIIRSFLGLDRIEEFVWILKPQDVVCFGFDDPEKPHILEWTYVSSSKAGFDKKLKKAFLEVDAMGSFSSLSLPSGPHVRCQIRAEHSTKVIEFSEIRDFAQTADPLHSLRENGQHFHQMLGGPGADVADDEENVLFSLRADIPTLSISVVGNADQHEYGREILLAQFERMFLSFSQTREGYQEFEVRLMSFQVDNHVYESIHPVMIFCPRADELEPLLHMSAVRRLQPNSNTYVFRYAAIRLLEVEIYLDRRTAETIAGFVQPLMRLRREAMEEPPDWVGKLTERMERDFSKADRKRPRDLDTTIRTANSGRIYLEQLHLHPVRLGLTFTQEWIDLSAGSDTVMVFQFIRGMASIANAPLVFTSFVVGHVFESPQALARVVLTHYSSQLTKQVFGILGSLAILGAPADFISNVGTGVRDFFYEPIQGAVHGPRQFIEGLEAGTQSLARGVFVGVVRGAANVAGAVNSNLAGLTADEDFIDERKAHQRMLTDAMSRDANSRTFGDSLNLACASLARGVKSGALGIVEQPAIYASKHGPVGFLKGVGKAVVGAVVKPVVGLGDGAVLVMTHMTDAATSSKQVFPKIPKRLRRALPSLSVDKRNCVRLEPYDERAAKAQKIVTGGESVKDVYIGHINLASHLIIASGQCLWAIDRRSREPWCVSWEEISHFGAIDGGIRIVVFSQTGLKTFVFQVESDAMSENFLKLLTMQLQKMANVSELNSSLLSADPQRRSRHRIAGLKARQVIHVFGSCNNSRKRTGPSVKDEIELVEQSHSRVKKMESSSSAFLKTLDQEAWSLVSLFGQIFSGLSSRRCIVASIINGTGGPVQIKSTKLVEGGSPCYSLATKEYDADQGVLRAGGVIIFFGWGVVPNLVQAGSVFMRIETNGFISDMADKKGSDTYANALPGYQVGFLEKSYDDSGWWAKYWLLVRCDN